MESFTKEEKETIIRFDQASDIAEIYTADEAWIRKLDKLCGLDRRIKRVRQDSYGSTYQASKKAVKVRLPRVLSQSERKEFIIRGKKNAHHLKRK